MADPQQAVQPGQPEPTMDVFSPPDPNTGAPGVKGKIPFSQWADAQKAGYEAAVRVTDKDGNGGWVPSSQAGEAIKNHGFKLGPPNQQKLDQPAQPDLAKDPSLTGLMGNGMPTQQDLAPKDPPFITQATSNVKNMVKSTGKVLKIGGGTMLKMAANPTPSGVSNALAEEALWQQQEGGVPNSKEVFMQPLREIAGERQPGESVTLGFTGNDPSQQPLLTRTSNMMSSIMGGDPASAREHFAQAAFYQAHGNPDAASAENQRGVADLTAVPIATAGFGRLTGSAPFKSVMRESVAGVDNAISRVGGGVIDSAQRLPDAMRNAGTNLFNAVDRGTDIAADALSNPHKTLTETLPRAAGRKARKMFGPPVPDAAPSPEVIPPERQLGQAPTVTPAPADTSGSVPYTPPPFDNTTRAQRLGLLLPEAAPEPIQMAASPLTPGSPEGLFPAASTVVHDPITGESRVQFLTSTAEPGASFTPHETQLLNDPRGAFSRFMQEDNLGGMSEPFASPGNTTQGMTIANPDMPTPADAGIVSRGGHPEEIVQNWLMRSKRGDVFNVARQLGIEVSPADSHSTLIPKILDRIGEEGAMDHMAEFAQGRRGTVPPGEKPPISNPDLSGILQQSIEQTPPRVTGQAPGSQAAIPPSDKVGGAKILKGDVPLTGPTSPVAADISRLKAELKSATDPKEIADIQQALDHAQARLEGRPYTPTQQADAENLPVSQPRTVEPEPSTRGSAAAPVAASSLQPGQAGTVKTADLNLDPKRFQFKLNTDDSGVTNQFKDTKKFNPDLAGVVSVWTDPADGKTYVVNGHHRVELAQRTGQQSMLVRHLQATTAENARAQGALINIAEGRGTAVDAAKFFRGSGLNAADIEKEGVSISESKVSDGMALSKLDPSIFDKVATGQMPEQRGIAIGNATSDPTQQEAIVKLIEKQEAKGRKVNNDTVAELSRFVANSGNKTIEQGGLFGANQEIHSLALDKAEISAYIKQQIAKEKKIFGAVADQGKAQILSRVKDQSIKAGENAAISQQAAQALELFDKMSVTKGPVDDILESAAKGRASGYTSPEEAKRNAYEKVRAELQKTLGSGQDGSGAGSQTRPGFPAPPK